MANPSCQHRSNRHPPPLLAGTNRALRHLPGIGAPYLRLLPMKRARGSALRKRRRKKRRKERIMIMRGMTMRMDSQPLGLRVSNRCRLEGQQRNWQRRQLQASLSLPRPLPRRRTGDERRQSEVRANPALHRRGKESRRVLLLSVGEAEVEVGVKKEEGGVEVGDGAGGAEGEAGRRTWTRWMSR